MVKLRNFQMSEVVSNIFNCPSKHIRFCILVSEFTCILNMVQRERDILTTEAAQNISVAVGKYFQAYQ